MYEMREREVRLQARIFDLDDGLERLEAMAEMRRKQEVAAEAEKGMPSTGSSCSELETLTCRTAESRDTGECDADGEGECCAICIMEYAPGQRICASSVRVVTTFTSRAYISGSPCRSFAHCARRRRLISASAAEKPSDRTPRRRPHSSHFGELSRRQWPKARQGAAAGAAAGLASGAAAGA